MQNARSYALASLNATTSKKTYSNLQLKAALSGGGLNEKESSLYKRLYFGVLERLLTLDFFINRFSNMKISKMSSTLLNCLRLGIYQLLYCDRISDGDAIYETVALAKKTVGSAANMINAILRKVSQNKELLSSLPSFDITYSVDSSIIDLLIKSYGQAAAIAYLEGLFDPAPIHAKVNTLKTDESALSKALTKENISAAPGALKDSLILTYSRSIEESDAYRQGLFFLQGSSSQAAVNVLAPAAGSIMLDMCSAPGLKAFSAALSMKNTGHIYAYDLHPHRVKLIEAGSKRLGISCIEAACADTALPLETDVHADFVLCDVPCSGLGMMQKHPEIRYKNTEDFASLPQLQLKILENAAAHTAQNGRLLYCTCTLNPAENQEIIDAFLKEKPEFMLKSFDCPLKDGAVFTRDGELTLMSAGGEGFYMALLCRR